MAKESGLGDRLLIGGYDLSGDIGAVDKVAGGISTLDVTAINKSAMERIGGLRDGGIDFTAYFNPAAAQAHPVLSALPTTDVQVSYLRGTTLGNAAASLVAKQVTYDGNRGTSGEFTFKVATVANGYGLQWGTQLTAGLRTDTAATNGTGVDLTTVSTAFGWTGFLHVTAFTGTSCTVTLQDSADNSSWANLTGGAFTAATGLTTQRLEGGATATVRRYVRAITSGTFTSCTFAVTFVRNETAVTY